MAPATEECRPNEIHGSVTSAENASPDPQPTRRSGSCCCGCCGCWQRRCSRARSPRGTDKAGTSDKETLLSGGKTRFYCCESKMTTRPPRLGSNRTRNSRNVASPDLRAATPVSTGLCPLFGVGGRRDSVSDEEGASPIEFAYDAFDERAYEEEFEEIHREEYNLSRTTENPLTPHSEVLLLPSQVGRVIWIKGQTYEDAQEFAVNLFCRERGDIAMHFNPRLDRGYIARNTKLNGRWGVEENSLNGPCPFKAGEEFALHILVAEEEYRFCHNGRHVCSYKHRVPIARLHILEVNGDVYLSMVRHETVKEFPPPMPPVALSTLLLNEHLLSVGHTALIIPTNRTYTWRTKIPKQSHFFLGHFKPNIEVGNEIIIGGTVRLLPKAFFINLQDGLQMWEPPEVHLHINPRFEDHNHIVLNARLKGRWGFEERHNRCGFQPGQPFKLTVRVDEDRYQVYINDSFFASMDHRARPTDINCIYVSGDVDITSVGFNKSPKSRERKEGTSREELARLDLGTVPVTPSTSFVSRKKKKKNIGTHSSRALGKTLVSSDVSEGGTILKTSDQEGKAADDAPKMQTESVVPTDEPSAPQEKEVVTEKSESVTGLADAASSRTGVNLPGKKGPVSSPGLQEAKSLPRIADGESRIQNPIVDDLGTRATAIEGILEKEVSLSDALMGEDILHSYKQKEERGSISGRSSVTMSQEKVDDSALKVERLPSHADIVLPEHFEPILRPSPGKVTSSPRMSDTRNKSSLSSKHVAKDTSSLLPNVEELTGVETETPAPQNASNSPQDGTKAEDTNAEAVASAKDNCLESSCASEDLIFLSAEHTLDENAEHPPHKVTFKDENPPSTSQTKADKDRNSRKENKRKGS